MSTFGSPECNSLNQSFPKVHAWCCEMVQREWCLPCVSWLSGDRCEGWHCGRTCTSRVQVSSPSGNASTRQHQRRAMIIQKGCGNNPPFANSICEQHGVFLGASIKTWCQHRFNTEADKSPLLQTLDFQKCDMIPLLSLKIVCLENSIYFSLNVIYVDM